MSLRVKNKPNLTYYIPQGYPLSGTSKTVFGAFNRCEPFEQPLLGRFHMRPRTLISVKGSIPHVRLRPL